MGKQAKPEKSKSHQGNAQLINIGFAKLFHKKRRYKHDRKLGNGNSVGHPWVPAHIIVNILAVIHISYRIHNDHKEDHKHGKKHDDPVPVSDQSLKGLKRIGGRDF